jgi:hypothetical protein
VPLSKSLFVAGCQCPKLLWWKVHEPLAKELQPDKVLLDLFDQGHQVTELARERFPGGALIDLSGQTPDGRVQETVAALNSGVPAVFEGRFQAGDVRIRADILIPEDDGCALVEVKSSSSVKAEHVVDAGIQAWVLRESGVRTTRVEVMHLNREYRHPAQGDLFTRTDITEAVSTFLPTVPSRLSKFSDVIAGDLPTHPIGAHCFEPWDCPFHKRCWPEDPHHISTLYNTGPKRTLAHMANGIQSIFDLPASQKLPDIARRQLRSLRENRIIVESGLAGALEPFEGSLGYLDFETVTRALPVWEGLPPWGQAVAQFSYHQETAAGAFSHQGWLAEGPGDPRRELAEALLDATRNARRIVMYSSFERTRIKELQQLLPDLSDSLEELRGKLIDLLPIVRDHVYHPDFRGSFSIKSILHPLVPDLTYNDLTIVNGLVASVEIARLLFVAHKIPVEDRDRLRQDLLDYCERDTWAMVRLLARMRELAAGAPAG